MIKILVITNILVLRFYKYIDIDDVRLMKIMKILRKTLKR